MQSAFIIPIIYVLSMGSGYAPIETHPTASQGTDWLQYDDGTPSWLNWYGTYRGVWFNTEDFYPGGGSFEVGTAELWFYHHTDCPWDISNVFIEIWNGDAMGPTEQLGQIMGLALHYLPIYIVFDPMIVTEDNFWCIINTEMSTGGWPSPIADDVQGPIYHSFYSEDFVVWEPCLYQCGDYFISVTDMIMGTDLSRVTWGGLKTVF